MTTDSAEAVEASEDEVLNHLERVRDGFSEFAVIEPEPESENDFFQTSTWTEGSCSARAMSRRSGCLRPKGSDS